MTRSSSLAALQPTANRKYAALAFFVPIVLLLPFVNRAYNVDEPMFVWVAQQIQKEPLDYYGFTVDKGNVQAPMYRWNQNPPGYSYYLAVFGVIGGWSEVSLHLGGLLWAGLFGLGMYRLAALLCPRPLFATAIAVLTPGFLVTASAVMTDLAQVTCYIWAVAYWLRWMKTDSTRALIAAAVWISAGALMKYYVITAVPLLLVYAFLKRKRPGPWLAALAVPILCLAAFWLWSKHLYGVQLLSLAAKVAKDPAARPGFGLFFREIVAVTFTGGCLAPIALYLPAVVRRRWLIGWILLCIALASPLVEGYSVLQLALGTVDAYRPTTLIQLALMFAAGGLLLWLPIQGVLVGRCAESVLLALWIFGALVFAVYVNNLISGRVLLPLVPATAIVLVRLLPRAPQTRRRFAPGLALAAGAVLSLWVTAGDYFVAENGRYGARMAVDEAAKEKVPLRYAGVWGFKYYLDRAGAKPIAIDLSAERSGPHGSHPPIMQHGDLLALSSIIREQWRVPPADMKPVDFYAYPNPAHVVTYHPADDAGFYAHLSGILPYNFAPIAPEEYGLYRWDGPDYTPKTGKIRE